MKLSFYGAAGTVTGSMYHLRVARKTLLFECGLFQGKRKESYRRNRRFPFDTRRVDAVILSHAHIDHSGNLPNLVKHGYDGPIYATHATRDLCASMLPDSGRIHEYDVKYVNKRRKRQGKAPVAPLYTESDALRTLDQFVGAGYGRPIRIGRGLNVTFLDAGHILGSSLVLLEAREGDRSERILFSGDLGQPNLPIVRDPTPMPPADVLLIESTYGDREHPRVEDIKDRLAAVVREVANRHGRIIIPAFAVGRTQEIVYHLHELTHEGRIPDIPIHVDSPLAVNVTEAFRMHPECYDHETREFLNESGDADPFGFARLRYVRSVEESKALNTAPNPMVIISASGMAEAGRVQHHLLHAVEDPRNAVLITGWQAPYTLGRRIAERAEQIRIFGDTYDLRAEVHTFYGYSAHADRTDLLNWAAPQADRVRRAFVVHGEPASSESLAGGLRDLGYDRVAVPERGETYEL